MPALEFKMKDINGKEQDLRQYQGNVVLMVNVASKCGLTPQYEGLEEVFKKYKDRGFVILGFPANNFLRQEPGSDEEIKAFCKKNYGVTFPMFSKVSVKGKDKCDLYAYLTNKKADHKFGGSIEWNFAKFIIDRDGRIAHRFSPRTTPDDKEFVAAIEKELEKAIPEDSPLAKRRAEEKKDKKPAPKQTP
ncbi:MAG: glutathione peroxidase [Phycisphaerales bacterium]|nr:glutathione peroxidase [Phycisphaerales bacterium]MCB9862342.1 glutathione peroxidase [Phycisphaerales bacterium]